MNFKSFIVSLFVLISLFNFSNGLSCMVCGNDSCTTLQSKECDSVQVTTTRDIFNALFFGVSTDASDMSKCISVLVEITGFGLGIHKGCAPAEQNLCTLSTRPGITVKECNLCESNNCNPATRNRAFGMALLIPIIFVIYWRFN